VLHDPLPIVAQGESWVVINKPSGLLVHRTALCTDRIAAVQLLRRQLDREVHPVHRLDRPTSGCLLFALRRDAVHGLGQALAAGNKRYIALVRGNIPTRTPYVVERALKDDNGRMKEATTELTPIASCAEPRCSVVLARPTTGRYHQVRRHIRGLDHPILGDSAHGDTRCNRVWRESHGLHRLALHCLTMELPLADGTVLSATAPLTDDLRPILRGLPLWAEAVERVPELAL
jgi:tRNA pseudouridine65 synthase